MKCVNHDSQEASAICSICHRPICETCLVELSDRQFCRTCLEKRIEETPRAESGGKRPFLAFLLSLIPGVGYLYLGLMQRGLQTMLVFYGAIFLAALANFAVITALVLPVTIFYTVFDTLQLLKRMNEGQPVADQPLFESISLESKRNLLGVGLIVVGALAMLNNLVSFSAYYYILNRFVPPVLILGLGIYILAQSARKEAAKDVAED